MNRYSWKSIFGVVLAAGAAFVLLGDGSPAAAQALVPPPPAASAQGAPVQTLSPDQLDDLVAPIALYPDPLVSQLLIASTYPLEVVEAQQWLQRNNSLRGAQLMDAARQQNWDASVQALVAFPDVLARLNQDVRWTTDLGNAFLAQQSDVMSAVQRMRARAQANGKLSSTQQQSVTTDTQGGQSAIEIQPTNPDMVYVPYYDPMYVWGPPAWGYYPALYYPSFGFGFWPGIDVGFYFGGWGGWGWGGFGWGWGPNWFGHNVFVNNAFFGRYGFHNGFAGRAGFAGRSVWAHDPGHRLGVPYSNRQLAGRYQAASAQSRVQRFGGQSSFNRSFSGNRNAFGSSRQGSSYAGRSAFQGSQSYRGASPQAAGRSYQSQRYQSQRNFQTRQYASRSSAPAMRSSSRSFGSGARSFGGGGHSFGGGGHSFGGGGHSFGGGGHGGRR